MATKFMRHTENKDLLQRIGEDTICELCLRIWVLNNYLSKKLLRNSGTAKNELKNGLYWSKSIAPIFFRSPGRKALHILHIYIWCDGCTLLLPFFPSLRCHIRNELEHKYHIVFEWISESKCFSEMLSWVEMERANKRVLRFASERAGKQHASIKYVSDCVQMRIAFRWRSEMTREKTHTDRSMHTHTRHITFCWDTTRRKHNINKNTRCEWF